jgi:methionine-rich copper-binding protein CopC
MRTDLIRRFAAAALVLGVSTLAPRVAPAHATLQRCNTVLSARLKTMPRTVNCFFAKEVNPKGSFIGIFEPTGDHGQDDNENSQVSFTNAKGMTLPNLPKGTYALIWCTISADDGHRAGGWFTFSLV